jgi:hypothetical protein
LRAKTCLVFLGTDFSESIKELILEPFANIIKEEIADEYENKLALKVEKVNCDINRLQSEINNYMQENQELRNKLAQTLDSNKNVDLAAVSSINQISNVAPQMDSKNKEDYVKGIIRLSSLTWADLKKEAKSKGLSVSSRSESKEDVILKILAADNNSDLKFS